NNGPAAATAVMVTDALPAGVNFVSANASQGTCTLIAGTVTCNLGTVDSASSAAVTLEVAVASQGTISNTASVSSAVTDPVSSNNTATAIATTTTTEVHDLAVT